MQTNDGVYLRRIKKAGGDNGHRISSVDGDIPPKRGFLHLKSSVGGVDGTWGQDNKGRVGREPILEKNHQKNTHTVGTSPIQDTNGCSTLHNSGSVFHKSAIVNYGWDVTNCQVLLDAKVYGSSPI